MAKNEIDALTGVETTGHDWDGIKELDNPLPRWWTISYLITIVVAVAMVWLYPAIPLGLDSTDGSLGYSQRQVVETEIAEAKSAQTGYLDQINATPLEDVLANPELVQFSMRGGQAAFNTNCAGCHGVGGGGQEGGYPVLADDAWLWGGEVDMIHETILWGIRGDSDDARFSEMPAFGADGILDNEQIELVADFVLTLTEASPSTDSDGAVLYEENCASCHGVEGEGLPDLGAPRLNDFVWLYGGERDQVIAQIKQPKHGVMPGFENRLDEATLRMLAVYVHELGGGQ